MKKLFFWLIATMFLTLNLNAQRPSLSMNPCGVGQHAVLSYEFNTLRFHRASAGCQKRFSICSDGTWTIDCVDNSQKSKYNKEKNTALIVGEIDSDGKNITLHFPIGIIKLKGYVSEDFKDFGFDSDYYLTKNIIIIKGDYVPVFTEDEILVTMPLKL